ncbi:MAG: cyclic nucleotide-binding domain-containing protein [Chloroflexi bacterium]|nr:cyclic nucleotide-binding domain-containing protein [Chloroflexota bacterium]
MQWKPAPAEGIVARELRERAGAFFILKNPRAHTYIRLTPREYWLWQHLDGKQTVQELIVAYFTNFSAFAFGLVIGLVQQLYAKQMLRDEPQFIFSAVERGVKEKSRAGRWLNPLRALISKQWAIPQFDRWISAVYQRGGWILFTKPAQAIFLLITFLGAFLYLRILGDPGYAFAIASLGLNLILLWFLTALPILLHELGHALTTKHFGSEVIRGGMMLYLGIPSAFVDTTDIWMTPKRVRLAVAAAGPYTGFILAGICAIAITLFPDPTFSPLLFQTATIALILSIVNLNPALKLDGYHLVSDAVEIPNLNERSFAFFRHSFLPKLLKRERFSRDEIVFILFGLLLGLWTLYVIVVTVFVWRARAVASAQSVIAGFDRNAILAIRVALLLGSLFAFVIARAWIGKSIAKIIDRVRRSRLVAGRRRAAIGIAVGIAVMLALPTLIAPEAAETLEFVAGVSSFAACAYLAYLSSRAMVGSLYARAWLLFAGAFALIGIANVLWWLPAPLTDAFALAFDLIGASVMGIAIASAWRLIVGLTGSWRMMSVWFFAAMWAGVFGMLLGPTNLSPVAAHFALGLIALGGIVHWHSIGLHPVELKAIAFSEQTARVALLNAFKSLTDHALAHVEHAYGKGARRRVETTFDQTARAKGWEIRLRDHSARQLPAESSYLRLPAADLGEFFAASLVALLDETARIGGTNWTEQILAKSYDALEWELREFALEYILPHVRWARALSKEFSAHRGDTRALLQRAPLFAEFSAEEIKKIAARLRPENFARGQIILEQGAVGEKFYLLRRGRVQVFRRDAEGLEHPLEELVSGDYFGERALLTGDPRNATIRAATPVEALTLSKKDFDRLIRPGFEGHRKVDAAIRRINLLRRIPIFADFSIFELRHLVNQLERVRVPAEQAVVRQGESGDQFYIIEEGQVAVRIELPSGDVVENARLGPGEYFGEIALLMDVPRTATIVTTQKTQLLTIHADTFKQLMWQSQGVHRAIERAATRRMHFYNQTLTRAIGEIPQV